MKGDFSRNFQPDRGRGKSYRRVLMQQGRLLLDSDVNALVDSQQQLVRELTSDVGCRAGSPDSGFVATGGPLLARFERLDHVDTDAESGAVRLDYTRRFGVVSPSLYVAAPSGSDGRVVRVGLRHPLEPGAGSAEWTETRALATSHVVVWVDMRGSGDLTLELGSNSSVLNTALFADEWIPVPIAVTDATDQLVLRLSPASDGAADGAEVRVGLVEGLQATVESPVCWATKGRYQIEGLGADLPRDAVFAPGSHLPEHLSLDAVDAASHLISYVDMREHHVDVVSDAGIRESALDSAADTCTRTKVMATVKLAPVAAGTDVDLLEADFGGAFASPQVAQHQLRFVELDGIETDDPCAVDRVGGYSGDENRLYRVEVHEVDDASNTLTVKWSRNNGSELYDVDFPSPAERTTIEVDSDANLRDGELVELLDDSIEYGDASLGSVSGAASAEFTPPSDRVGPLFVLQKAATQDSVAKTTFNLVELTRPEGADLGQMLKQAAADNPRIRKWDDIVEVPLDAEPTDEFALEASLGFQVSGEGWRPGDWWSHEARRHVSVGSVDQEFRPPEGPERLYAPLALLRRRNVEVDTTEAREVLEVLRWLDTRQPPTCGLVADDIAYDNVGRDTEADTVQEAIDELFERDGADCCTVVLHPTSEDLAIRLSSLVEAADGADLTVCLRASEIDETFQMNQALEIDSARLELRGCDGTIVELGTSGGFDVLGHGELGLADLTLIGPAQGDARPIIECTGGKPRLEIVDSTMSSAGAHALIASSDFRAAGGELPSSGNEINETVASIGLERAALIGRRGLALSSVDGLTVLDSTILADETCIHVTQIDGLDVRDTLVSTELSDDIGLEAARSPASIRALFLETAAAAAQLTGTAIRAEYLASGVVADCDVRAGTGLDLGEARGVELRQNGIVAASAGVEVVDAKRIRLFDNELQVHNGIGFMLHRSAVASSIENCLFDTASAGVYLGWPSALKARRIAASSAPVFDRAAALSNVTVADNHIYSDGDGVVVGGGIEAIVFTRLRGVDIRNNHIEGGGAAKHRTTGIRLASVGMKSVAQPSVAARGNHISGFGCGIYGSGSGLSIIENHVRLTASRTQVCGVLLTRSDGARLRGNTIVLYDKTGLELDERPPVVGIESTEHLKRPGAIQVEGGRALRVVDNHVKWAPIGLAIDVDGPHPGLIVSENKFDLGGAHIVDADGVDFCANHIGGSVLIRSCLDGTVVSNHVTTSGLGSEKLLAKRGLSIRVEKARGVWKIDENRADDHIVFKPAIRTGFLPFDPGDWKYDKYEPVLPDLGGEVLDPGLEGRMDVLLGDGEYVANYAEHLMMMSESGESDEPAIDTHRLRVLRDVDDEVESEFVEMSLLRDMRRPIEAMVVDSGDDDSGGDDSSRLLVDVEREAARGIAEILGDLTRDLAEIDPNLDGLRRKSSEKHVDVQVVANRSSALIVGHRPPVDKKSTYNHVAPHPDSVAQVVSNRADLRIVVNRYQTRVIQANLTDRLID